MEKNKIEIIQHDEPTVYSLSELERKSFVFEFLNNIRTISETEKKKLKEEKGK